MNIPQIIRSNRRLALGLALAGFIAGPALAQATASVPCAVRIRPRAVADYDPSTEVVLRGRVMGRENGMLLLRLSAGIVKVNADSWGGSVVGAPEVEVLASMRVEEGRQRFLAREIRSTEGLVAIRDAQGVPL